MDQLAEEDMHYMPEKMEKHKTNIIVPPLPKVQSIYYNSRQLQESFDIHDRILKRNKRISLYNSWKTLSN